MAIPRPQGSDLPLNDQRIERRVCLLSLLFPNRLQLHAMMISRTQQFGRYERRQAVRRLSRSSFAIEN